MSAAVLELHDVSVAYDRRLAVQGITGAFKPGSLTAIAGPNGAGKSTLLKAVMGDLPLASGKVSRAASIDRPFGYLPQAAEIDRHFPLTVIDTVMLGTWGEFGAFRGISKSALERGRAALRTVGLEGFERRHIGTLSAGQFQRVLFARLLLQDSQVILLDEPFTAIDAATTRDLLKIVRHWHDGGRTVIAVLHDFDQIRDHFPQTLLMACGAVGWGATDMVLTPENLDRARGMAESFQTHGLHRGMAA